MIVRLLMCVCLLALSGVNAVVGQQPSSEQAHRLSLPNKTWSVDVALRDFYVIGEEVKIKESIYDFSAGQFPDKNSTPPNRKVSEPRLVNFAIHMEPAQTTGTAADFRDFARKKMTKVDYVNKDSVKPSEYGQIPLLLYTIDLAGMGVFRTDGGPPRSKGVKAFFVKDGVWITIGLGANPFKKQDEQLFYSILDSVKISDNKAPVSSFDYYQQGKALFLQHKSLESVAPLRRALELEQQSPQLGKAEWRKLVWALVDAYYATSDRANLEEVLEYGLNHDPTYYRFHLTKAGLYASDNKLDDTIASLEKAFQYHRTEPQVIQTIELITDPLFDPAFARFHKDEKFRKAVKAMKK